jgi:hypothetical protein
MQDSEYLPEAPAPQPSEKSRGKRPQANNGPTTSGEEETPPTPPSTENIVIKNHFPVARIKRIMQADDDVGKVAQVTPVVVCMFPAFS